MTTIDSSTTISIQLSTDIITSQITTDSSDSDGTSLSGIHSSIVILIWFEITAACIIYGLGFIGNLLSFIVFCSLDEFRRISTGSFFLFTTISNSIHLWTLITEFLGVYNIYIYSNGFVQCQLNYFIQNLSRSISTNLAVGIAFDRFIRSEIPMRSRMICTRRNAIIFTLINLIIFSLLWSFWFCPLIIQDPITKICIYDKSPSFYFFLNQIQIPVRFILVCIIPVIIMAAANIRMLYNMRQSRRRVQNRIGINTTMTAVTTGIVNSQNIRRMSAIDRMLFYMMLANVGTFIITQIPFHIYTLVRAYNQTLDAFTHSLVRVLLLIWSSIYFGVAFYLYCLASPLFREKFVMMSKKLMNFIKRRPV